MRLSLLLMLIGLSLALCAPGCMINPQEGPKVKLLDPLKPHRQCPDGFAWSDRELRCVEVTGARDKPSGQPKQKP